MSSFAEKMGTTRQNLYSILRSPSYPTLEKVATVLGVPMWELFASKSDIMENEENVVKCPNCGHELTIEIKVKE